MSQPTPPDKSEKPTPPDKPKSDGKPSPSSNPPPPGSKGYRKIGDPLPRGIPLTGGSRTSSSRSGSSKRTGDSSSTNTNTSSPAGASSGGAAPVAPRNTPATPPSKPDRPLSPTAGNELPPNSPRTVARPQSPKPIGSSIGDTSSVISSPKVPKPNRPAAPYSPPVAPPIAPSVAPSPVAASSAVTPRNDSRPAGAPFAAASAAASTGPSIAPSQATIAGDPPPPDAVLPSEAGFPAPADRRRLFLWIAILVSLALHGSLAWEIYDRPLSHIDPSLLHQQRDVYRVFRAPQDLILPDMPGDDANAAAGKTPADTKTQSPLTDLSMALLSAPDEAQIRPVDTAQIKPQPKPFEDQKPKTPEAQGEQGQPDIQLPDTIQSQLKIEIPLATTFVGSGGSSDRGNGTGSANGAGSNGSAGSGQSQAASLLAQGDGFGDGMSDGFGSGQGSGFGTPTNPLPPSMGSLALNDKASINDARVMPSDLTPTPLDLSSITDKAATRLSIPEHLDNDFDYTVSRFIPKGGWGVPADEERGYFRVDITAKRSLKKLQTMPKDLVIVVDTSGSIPQEWLDRTMQGISDSLSSLNTDDRFNIVFFAEKTAILGPQGNLPANKDNIEKAREFLGTAKAGGSTDVNQALSRLLVRDVAVDRAYELILISDGRPTSGVMGTRELINLITRDNDLSASIYCLGIGKRQNKTLLEFLAYRNKGFCVFSDNPFQAAIDIRDMVSRLRYPIMKDIQLSALGLNIEEVFPSDLPTIHQGETFSIFGRFDNPGKPFTMRLLGHNGKQMFDFTFTRDLATAPLGDKQISTDWAFWKLHHLYNQILRHGETNELRQAITYLRRKYKLNTLYD